mmetsp:Transcript_16878/g.28049  ORF Transcript_16878/g.28049 Transcript_16878/m.28049 type:complete len:98 (+) Transcript_16878:1851-2144(+)
MRYRRMTALMVLHHHIVPPAWLFQGHLTYSFTLGPSQAQPIHVRLMTTHVCGAPHHKVCEVVPMHAGGRRSKIRLKANVTFTRRVIRRKEMVDEGTH